MRYIPVMTISRDIRLEDLKWTSIPSLSSWALWVLTAVAAYLGAYAAEKGKRRAAREDSDSIREELARTTRALKEIEAAITLNV